VAQLLKHGVDLKLYFSNINYDTMVFQRNRLIGMTLIIGFLLFIPFIAMQFTDQVQWTLSDFVIMGSVLLAVGLAYELIARRSDKTVYRIAFGTGLAGAFLLLWMNGAVGIIGNEGQPANLMYAAVFIVGFTGSLMARFRARGMAYALFAAAATQMLIPVVALFAWPPPDTSWSPGVFRVFMLNGFFAMVFVLSGMLFRRAGG
jgi:hypothetical protein